MSPETTKGWAIVSEDRPLGKYYWFGRSPMRIPEHMDGYVVAVFRTRKVARYVLPGVRRYRPDARIVRVRVTVEPMTTEAA